MGITGIMFLIILEGNWERTIADLECLANKVSRHDPCIPSLRDLCMSPIEHQTHQKSPLEAVIPHSSPEAAKPLVFLSCECLNSMQHSAQLNEVALNSVAAVKDCYGFPSDPRFSLIWKTWCNFSWGCSNIMLQEDWNDSSVLQMQSIWV